MERMLATPADAEIILKLYQLRTEALMREARAWVAASSGRQRPRSFSPLLLNPADPHNAICARCSATGRWRRPWCCTARFQQSCLWTATARGFFCWPSSRPFWMRFGRRTRGSCKTSEVVNRFSAASQRYEATLKSLEARRAAHVGKTENARPAILTGEGTSAAKSLAEFALPGA